MIQTRTVTVYADSNGYLCFKHAVHQATKGVTIVTESVTSSNHPCYICDSLVSPALANIPPVQASPKVGA